jgi:hypothetical protein
MSDVPSLIPYVVPWDPLRAFFGGRDVPELERIKNIWKTQIAENADVYGYMIQNGAPTLGQALDHLCAGDVRKPEFASQYAWALEVLCAHIGQKHPNASVTRVEESWLAQTIDPVFRGWGLGMVFTTKMLIHGAWPLHIPQPTGTPYGGSVSPDEVEHALMVMRSATPPGRLDLRAVQVLGEIRGWLEAAAARHAGLVCFYY